MEGPYYIKVKVGDVEIEIGGEDKDFVGSQIHDIITSLENSNLTTTSKKAVEVSPRQEGSVPPKVDPPQIDSPIVNPPAQVDGHHQLAIDAGISFEELQNVLDISKDGQIFIHVRKNGVEADNQRRIAKIALVASEYIQKQNELSGKGIGKFLVRAGVSTDHLAANLEKEEAIFRQDNYYKLRPIGRKETLTLIKNLATQQNGITDSQATQPQPSEV